MLADPLLRFVGELEGNAPARYGETVNIAPLFSCQGGVDDSSAHTVASDLRQRVANADTLVSLLAASDWRPLIPAEGLRSGIVLLQASGGLLRATGSGALRQRFHKAGLALTTYSRGVVRVSLPSERWRRAVLELAAGAFGRVAQTAATAPAALAS